MDCLYIDKHYIYTHSFKASYTINLFTFISQDLVYNPPSLLELSGRVIKIEQLPYSRQDLPRSLYEYLNSAHRCVNPECAGKSFNEGIFKTHIASELFHFYMQRY